MIRTIWIVVCSIVLVGSLVQAQISGSGMGFWGTQGEFGQPIPNSGPVCLNGPATATLEGNSQRLIVAGSFTKAQVCTGMGAFFSKDIGQLRNFDTTARMNGYIYAAIPDGNGGLYIGGDFTAVDGVARYRLARLKADGSLDLDFAPGASTNGTVNALHLEGGKLYVGGGFTFLSTSSRRYLGAVNATTGALDSWSPITSADGTIVDLKTKNGKIYAAGLFTAVNGLPRNGLVVVDMSSGEIDVFNIGVNQHAVDRPAGRDHETPGR